MTSNPILTYPNFDNIDKTFLLTTYTSEFALGEVRSQGPIEKTSSLAILQEHCNAETKYSTIERKLLAIGCTVEHFRPYRFTKKCKLITDHRPLTSLFSMKGGVPLWNRV